MDTPSLTSTKQDAGSFVHVRINCPCRGVHRLKGQTLNYRTLVYCSSNNLTLNRHTKTLTNKHKMPFNSTCQLGCRVIDLFNFFCCVDQEWHWATQEGHFIKINDPHQQWTETRLWMPNSQSLGKSRGTQRWCNWRGLFVFMNMFVNFLFVTHLALYYNGWLVIVPAGSFLPLLPVVSYKLNVNNTNVKQNLVVGIWTGFQPLMLCFQQTYYWWQNCWHIDLLTPYSFNFIFFLPLLVNLFTHYFSKQCCIVFPWTFSYRQATFNEGGSLVNDLECGRDRSVILHLYWTNIFQLIWCWL